MKNFCPLFPQFFKLGRIYVKMTMQLHIHANKSKNYYICCMSSGSDAEGKLSLRKSLYIFCILSDDSIVVEQPLISDNVTVV